MSGDNTAKPSVRKTRFQEKLDIVPCIICEVAHARRPGVAHVTSPVCQTCDDHINKQPNDLMDTVDFQVKGF